jgi:transcriptional regulator, TetR family
MIDEQIHQVYSNYDMVKDANPFDYVVDNVLSAIYEGIR